MKLLHIIATPRGAQSNTMQVSAAFIDDLRAKHPNMVVDELNVFTQELPSIGGNNIDAKYGKMMRMELNASLQQAWNPIEQHVERFLAADIYVITTPLWNFSIPYALKHYIDTIIQPGYLFYYNEQGQPVGMVHDKKMVCITSRGGDYSQGSPFQAYDFQEPYLRSIFGFVGIYDMQFINAQPVDISPELRETAMAAAIAEASQVVAGTQWAL